MFAGLVGLALCAVAPSSAQAESVHGALIMDHGKRVDTDRYKMAKNWDRTIRFYHRVYGKKDGYTWEFFADTPKVRAIHIENLNRKKGWEGLNIYETRKGVFVYVIKAEEQSSK